MNRRREDERQHHRANQPTNHHYCERLQHFRACADPKRQGQHAGDGSQCRHGNGPKTAAAGLQEDGTLQSFTGPQEVAIRGRVHMLAVWSGTSGAVAQEDIAIRAE